MGSLVSADNLMTRGAMLNNGSCSRRELVEVCSFIDNERKISTVGKRLLFSRLHLCCKIKWLLCL
jgi:hypothetical protein